MERDRRTHRLHRALVGAALASALGALALPAAASANHSPFDVNDAGDASDANIGNGTCLTAGAVCTLRAAIQEANAHAGTDSIIFSIGAADSQQTITVGAAAELPAIMAPVTIDGTTQCATACTTPKIELDGNDATDGAGRNDALRLAAGSDASTIKGLIVNDSAQAGIAIDGSANNLIQGNWIGLEETGTTATGNADHGIAISPTAAADTNTIGGVGTLGEGNVIAGNIGAGVRISSGTGNAIKGNLIGLEPDGTTAEANIDFGISDGGGVNTSIGGSAAGEGNVISGHTGVVPEDAGILVTNTATPQIKGNRIGTDASGAVARGNRDGIRISSPTVTATVGGAAPGERNLISANLDEGIVSVGQSTTIRGNYIGPNAAGTAAVGNQQFGINLVGVSGTTVLGGTAPGARNVISGNANNGLRVETGTGTLTVQGNLVGTTADGMSPLGNSNQGIRLDNTNGIAVTIGGASPGAGNVVSASGTAGIRLAGSGEVVQGNLVGTDATGGGGGTFGNNQTEAEGGIRIANGSSNSVVGGTGAGEGNTVANTASGGAGIAYQDDMFGSAGSGNRVRGNDVFGNSGLGIDLIQDGITANDALDADAAGGGFSIQNFPALTSASRNASTINVAGTLSSSASHTFDIDLFASTTCDPLGNGEGEFFLGSTTVMTNGSGSASFSLSLPTTSPAGATQITATATRTDVMAGDSSEFSECFTAGAISTGGGTPSTPAAVDNPECAELRAKLTRLNRKIRRADDPEKKAKLKQKRRKVRKRLRDLGC